MDNILSISNLKVNHRTFEGEKEVLNIGELNIKEGEAFALVGESGTGKTVLALTILKLLASPPGVIKHGHIVYDGEDLLCKTEKEMQMIRGEKISMIFQDPMSTLNPVFTVEEQITDVIQHHQGVRKRIAQNKAMEMFELVRLPDVSETMKKYPHELSGGQRQRVTIAIALSCGAEFIIADEPTRNLDTTVQASILKTIKDLQRDLKVTILFIANNLGIISAICDRVAIIHGGKIIEMGSITEVLRNPLHPYTEDFIKGVARSIGTNVGYNESVGNIGCSYYDICTKKEHECKQSEVTLKFSGGTHYVSCLKAGGLISMGQVLDGTTPDSR